MRTNTLLAPLYVSPRLAAIPALLVAVVAVLAVHTPMSVPAAASLALLAVATAGLRGLGALAPRGKAGGLGRTTAAIDLVQPGLGAWIVEQILARPVSTPEPDRLGQCLATIPSWIREARDRREAIDLSPLGWPTFASLPAGERASVEELCQRAADLAAGQVRRYAVETLLEAARSWWQGLVVVTAAAVGVHVTTAAWLAVAGPQS